MIRPCTCSHLETAHSAVVCAFCHCTGFEDATTEHTAELRDLAVRALTIAKANLKRNGGLDPFFLFREANDSIQRFDLPGPLCEGMNYGRAKDIIFGSVRATVQEFKIKAVVIVTDGWFGRPTAKGLAMPLEEFHAATRDRGLKNPDPTLVERCETVIVMVQTPVRQMSVYQLYERDEAARKITFHELVVMETGIDEFRGRMKMFGDLSEENLG